MKVLIINESDYGGGAAIAATRIADALKNYTDNEVVFRSNRSLKKENVLFEKSTTTNFLNKSIKYVERRILNLLKTDSHDLLNLDILNFHDLTNTFLNQIDEINPDVINLHWVNNGFFSVKQIKKLADKYKILWTLHDMWPMLGLEHYERSQFQDLKRGKVFNFLNGLALKEKSALINHQNIYFGCISNWLKEELEQRWGLKERVYITPNTYSELINNFEPSDKKATNVDGGFNILLASKSSDSDYRKGFDILKSVLNLIDKDNITLNVLGCKQDSSYRIGKVKVNEHKSTNDEKKIIQHFKNSDLHICCSRMDNYPNTILEANGLLIPTIAFKVGGVSDMIEHDISGFLIEPFNIEKMTETIERMSKDDEMRLSLRKNLQIRKIENSNSVIADSLDKVFQEIVN